MLLVSSLVLAVSLLAPPPPNTADCVGLSVDYERWSVYSVAPDGTSLSACGVWSPEGTQAFLDAFSGVWSEPEYTADVDLAVLGPPNMAVCIQAAKTVCGGGNVCWVTFVAGPVENICSFSCGQAPCNKEPSGTNPVLDPPLW